MYVLHLTHRELRGIRRVAVDGRLEGLKISMVRAVVWWLEYYLGRTLRTVRLPTWKLTCVPKVSVHCRDITVANGLNETKWQTGAVGGPTATQAICQER